MEAESEGWWQGTGRHKKPARVGLNVIADGGDKAANYRRQRPKRLKTPIAAEESILSN